MTESTKTFVFNNTEVKLTGRTANKELKSTRRGAKANANPTVAVLFEITPIDQLNGSWKKWVKMAELFEITEGM